MPCPAPSPLLSYMPDPTPSPLQIYITGPAASHLLSYMPDPASSPFQIYIIGPAASHLHSYMAGHSLQVLACQKSLLTLQINFINLIWPLPLVLETHTHSPAPHLLRAIHIAPPLWFPDLSLLLSLCHIYIF